ncbi:MAG: Re/Si-specific NAD(P)(+) transhydrogenase subunit alpha [Myxococcota bacterium]|nr:NAD(P)(+) transhydrogenase (Re/Si-specific) subunit alpha [Deltaproteobacteria bacterium]MCP4245233.1 Re/Si-specific NAD(P)(+) transhydrogenase subunit alpha [bacterium]MDP6073433.1 Re/Si-specific NAD(P)(+) transhydrogenase subunit alpha [Myxococcota bacterium]MDP6243237.1 Re/Si-specific NAD(P)(+) transhydrogenase subunit alpha [Myxococcota bacterium]MDP7074472.1 Re/Si-specific NAD(P)(+) transhydrogenase subunit alpha [Myxococcota bacterium]
MIVGVVKETRAGERRVALVPDAVKQLAGDSLEILVEADAGAAAGFPDSYYSEVGATIAADAAVLHERSTVILRVQSPADGEVEALRRGQFLIGLLEPLDRPQLARQLADRGVTAFAMELMPRITRAQSMDALSSQSTIAGYRAVLLAATYLPKIFPMLVTAAGTLSPAKVLVIGAGVAGLQAIGTARRLGAVVEAYDTRPAVKEQVESLGARFVELDLDTGDAEDAGGYARAQSEDFYRQQREQLGQRVARSDVVITTALVPGQTAPRLIEAAAVEAMRPGSVVVDLAAAKGGNCAVTEADRIVNHGGVSVLGHTNLAAEIPAHASQMYAKNLVTFLKHLLEEGELQLDLEDEITKGALLTHEGAIANDAVRARAEG